MRTNAQNEDCHSGYVQFSVWGIGFTGGYMDNGTEPPTLYTLFFGSHKVSWDNFSEHGIEQIDAAFLLAYEEEKANAF